jgi:predicted neutral ceramidase superfamily lipid hydrolase
VTWEEFRLTASQILGPAILAISVLVVIASLALRLQTKRPVQGSLSLIVAFAAVGVTSGMAAGNSREPIVGAMLPAMLTLVSGLFVYIFSKEGLANWRPVIPFCVAVVAVGGLVGLSLGSTVRSRFDTFERDYAKALLRYEHVELEAEKARYLAELEVWKAKQLQASPSK